MCNPAGEYLFSAEDPISGLHLAGGLMLRWLPLWTASISESNDAPLESPERVLSNVISTAFWIAVCEQQRAPKVALWAKTRCRVFTRALKRYRPPECHERWWPKEVSGARAWHIHMVQAYIYSAYGPAVACIGPDWSCMLTMVFTHVPCTSLKW